MTSWAPDRLDLFILGTDSFAYHKAWIGGASPVWDPSLDGWTNMGGIFSHPPVAVTSEPNHLDVFAIDFNASLRHKAWDSTQWVPSQTGWDDFSGQWAEKPAVVSWGPDRVDVFLIGTDRGLYQKFWDGANWNNGFVSFGGSFAGPPTAVSWEPGRIDVFGTGYDGNVWHKWFDNTGWHPNGVSGGFELMGGSVHSQPKAVSWGPDRIDLFAVGADSTLWHKWWDSSVGRWGPAGTAGAWESLGGNIHFTPEAVSLGPGQLDIFVVGVNSSAFHKSYNSSRGWSPSQNTFESLDGEVIADIRVTRWFPQTFQMFTIGADSGVYQKAWGPFWFPSMTGYQPLGGSSRSPVS